jgi:hypothetical protein
MVSEAGDGGTHLEIQHLGIEARESRVWGQPGLCSETLCQKQQQQKPHK